MRLTERGKEGGKGRGTEDAGVNANANANDGGREEDFDGEIAERAFNLINVDDMGADLINVDDMGADWASTSFCHGEHGFARRAVIWFGMNSGIAWIPQARSFSHFVRKVTVNQRPISSFTRTTRVLCMLTWLMKTSAISIGPQWRSFDAIIQPWAMKRSLVGMCAHLLSARSASSYRLAA
jgi:hypothetical protein